VNDDLIKYYELLGVAPGVSAQELKTAHRDLAKVWHPDRFAHDPRLQQKAQEKLKEINEAYDQLALAKTGRRKPVTTASAAQPSQPTPASARPVPLTLILLPALAFAVLVFVAYRTLIPESKPSTQSAAQTAEQPTAPQGETGQQSGAANTSRAVDSARGKRGEQPLNGEMKPGGAATVEEEARQVRPLPTATVTIDPVSGMLARPECPTKSRMTYPSGSEPRQYCNVSHKSDAPERAKEARPKESRLKSFAKRLGSPAKLFGGKEGSDRNP
jgi:hypothetical protein